MTHSPPLEDCWCWNSITVCSITPHIDGESQVDWENRHARHVAQDMQDFPENC